MKRYFLAAFAAIAVLAGPCMGSANAQGWFSRGGSPTFVDRLVGNGYRNPYGGYRFNNYNYGNSWGRCNRGYYGGGGYPSYGSFGRFGNGWGGGGGNGWGGGWGGGRYHHHHHHW